MKQSVLLVGHGNMGRSLVNGWITSKALLPNQILVIDPNDEQRRQAQAQGIAAVADIHQLPNITSPDLIILAVKPQVLSKAAAHYVHMAQQGTTVASIAAGTSIAALEKIFGHEASIVRIMPNTPSTIGKGMMVIYFKSNVSIEARDFVVRLMEAGSKVHEITDELLMDAVTAISGSGPAYVFHFIECLIKAGESHGLPPETARLLAVQTVYGAATLVAKSEIEPSLLREQVTSPNGTTSVALRELMNEKGLMQVVKTAVSAACERSVQLRADE